MSDPIWLDGYEGQSVDELLAMEPTHRVDSLVQAFEQALDEKAGQVGFEGLSQEERIILAVEALEREVNNGGYGQFFENSSCEYAGFIVEALNRIQCKQTAEITARAIDGLHLHVLSQEAIEAVMQRDDVDRDDQLNECDEQYYSAGEDIAGQLFQFIKSHKDRIVL